MTGRKKPAADGTRVAEPHVPYRRMRRPRGTLTEEMIAALRADPAARAQVSALLGLPLGLADALDRLTAELREQRRESAEDRRLARERFEAIDRRFEELRTDMNTRFEKLISAVHDLRIHLAGVSDTIGFGLESIGQVVLPGYLERHLKVKLDVLERRFFEIGKDMIEVDLYGEGLRDGEPVAVVVEVKSRIYRDQVAQFLRKLEAIGPRLVERQVLPLMFGYLVHPSARDLAEPKGITLVVSYQR